MIYFLTYWGKKGSSLVRGYSIAEQLRKDGIEAAAGQVYRDRSEIKFDVPIKEINKNDTVIFVKQPPIPEIADKAGKVYIDVVEHTRFTKELKNDQIGIITATPSGVEVYKKIYPENKVIWIPHPHCNNKNRIRPRRDPIAVLYDGGERGFPWKAWNQFSRSLVTEINQFTVIRGRSFFKREEICWNLYHSDIFVSFRERSQVNIPPTKLNNAGSFKIPCIAFPESSFQDNYGKPGNYIPVFSLTEMVEQCLKLRDEDYYNSVAEAAWRDAQPYHISKIVEYYKNL